MLAAAIALVGGPAFLGGIPILVTNFLSMFVDWPSHALLVFILLFWFPNPAVLVGFYCLLMLMYLIVGAGLLRLQNWARLVVVVLAILNLVVGAIGLARPRWFLFRQLVIAMLIEVGALIYLIRLEVKKAFGTAQL